MMKCNKNTRAKALRGVVHSVLVTGAVVCMLLGNYFIMKGLLNLIFATLFVGFAMTEWVFIDTIRKMDGKPTTIGMIIGSTKLNDDNVETCVEEVELKDGNIIYLDAYVMDTND